MFFPKSKKASIIIAIVLVSGFGIGIGYSFYRKIFSPNVTLSSQQDFIFIKTKSTFTDVVATLDSQKMLLNKESFEWLAGKMKYDLRVLPGKYKLTNGMSNRELILLLRSGKQTPVRLIFNSVRTVNDLAGVVSRQIEADSLSLVKLFLDTVFLNENNFTDKTVSALFIPNTYEFYWNTPAEKFFKKMLAEYNSFWNEERKATAKKIELSPVEVSTLASVVEQESNRTDEKPVIAGVYLNRLRKGWKMEADPTLVFAAGNFNIRRVLNQYKEIDSPYNTYKYYGLPPGPICIPSVSSIDAVLHYTQHEYMYFCARDDMSGYHAFAVDYSTHLINARKFQKELNRRNIKR